MLSLLYPQWNGDECLFQNYFLSHDKGSANRSTSNLNETVENKENAIPKMVPYNYAYLIRVVHFLVTSVLIACKLISFSHAYKFYRDFSHFFNQSLPGNDGSQEGISAIISFSQDIFVIFKWSLEFFRRYEGKLNLC